MAGKLMQAVWYDSYGGGSAGLKHVEIPFLLLARVKFCLKLKHQALIHSIGKFRKESPVLFSLKNFPIYQGGGGGGLAEYVVAKETSTVQRPPEVSAADAASLVIAGCTALCALTVTGRLKLDKTGPLTNVLVTNGSGGVGHYVVQLAKLGNTHITATCGARNIEFVKSLGADEVLDYKTPEGVSLKSPSSQKYDLVIHCTVGIPWSTFKANLTPTGKVIHLTPSSGTFWNYAVNKVMFSNKQIVPLIAVPKAKEIEFLANLVKEGKIKSVIDSTYPLSRAEEGWAKSIEGLATGKVVVECLT